MRIENILLKIELTINSLHVKFINIYQRIPYLILGIIDLNNLANNNQMWCIKLLQSNQSKLFESLSRINRGEKKKERENQFAIQKTRVNAKDRLIIFRLGRRPVAEKTSSLTDRFKRQHHEEMAFLSEINHPPMYTPLRAFNRQINAHLYF